ncbi:MAG: gamma-glutamyl-gamma-aminobutyrate hydrolase family protein [Chlorobi bacterium]|nr:gamma-glutamyl-gamma-aminobutyrate hydrolase family protein [Chlorobiota bacterium]
MKIAVSKGNGSPKYQLYADWLSRIEPSVEVVDLSSEGYNVKRAQELLQECVGIVFTGGADLDPVLYGAEEYRSLCGVIERDRDDFELALFEHARRRSMPILGICRGLQLINVACGGSLIADIPSQITSAIHHEKMGKHDSEHAVEIEGGTVLSKILRTWDGMVNSAHHQAVERLGEGLTSAARSEDGIVEAITWQHPDTTGFMVAVQWHPERMRERDVSPLARKLGEHFVFECQSYALLMHGRSYDREQFMAPPEGPSDAGY